MPNFSWAGPNTMHKYMKGSASESIRNACFNLERLSSSSRLARPWISAGVGLIQALSTRIRIRLKTQFFFSFSKTLASTRSVFASFSPVHTYTVNRFENDNLPDCVCLTRDVFAIRSPRNNKLAPSLNFVWCGFILLWRSSKSQKQFKMSKSGQNKVKLKGGPIFRLLTPVAEGTW